MAGTVSGSRGFSPLFLLLAAILCVLVLLPLGWLLVYAATDDDWTPTLANLIYIASDPDFVGPFVTTVQVAAWVAACSCVAAAPLAWLVTSTNLPFPRLIRILTIASFVTPPFLGAISWELLASPNTGLINQLIRAVLGQGAPVFNIYSKAGVVFVMTCYAFPYVFVVLSNAIEAIPSQLEEASAVLGAGRARTLFKITVPLILPALLAGASISFIQAMTQFGTPAILALPANFLVVTTLIASYFSYPPQLHLAAAAALPILAVTMLLLWLQKRALGGRSFAVIGGKGGARRRFALGLWRWPVFVVALTALFVVVLLPNLVVLKLSVSHTFSNLLAPGNWDFSQFANVFALSQTPLVFRNTLFAAVLAACLGVTLAVVVAYVTTRRTSRFAPFLGTLASAPIAVPGIVLGVGLFLAYTRPPFRLYGTIWILLLAFVTIELPAAFQMLQAAFRGLHREMEEAARVLGASPARVMIGITVPLLSASVVAAWCFIFIGGIRELSAAILLSTANTKLVSVLIFDFNQSTDFVPIAVLGVTVTLITLAVVSLASRLARKREALPGQVRP